MSYNDYVYICSSKPSKSLEELERIYGKEAVDSAIKEIEEIQGFFDPELSDDQNDRWIEEQMLCYPKGIESILEMRSYDFKKELEEIVPF